MEVPILKILLIDDHPIFLEGLKNLLLSRGEDEVDTATSGEDALNKINESLPDVIFMDIMMKPLSGLQITRLIKSKFPNIKIIMLTASESEDDLFESVKSGASGYLLKSLDADVLYEMLNQYRQGEIPLSPGLAIKLLDEFKKNDISYVITNDSLPLSKESYAKINDLSTRQKEVLILVAKGLKYKEIAAKLGVSERTIKYYMEMILNKLHMENRNQAIKYAVKKGFVD